MGSDYILAWVAWMMSFAAWLAMAGLTVRLRSGALFATVIAVFVSMIARPPIVLFGLSSPIPSAWFAGQEPGTFALGSAVSCVWILVLTLSFAFWTSAGAPAKGLFPRGSRALQPGVLLFWGGALIAVSAGITFYLVAVSGGFGAFQFAVKVSKDFAGAYMLRHIGTLGLLLVIVALISFARLRGTGRKQGLLFWLSAAALLLGLATNFLWGNRYNIALILIGLAFSWHYHVRRLSPVLAAVLGLCSVAALQGLRVLRTALFSENVGRDLSGGMPFWQEISLSLHFQEFDAMLLAVRDVGNLFDFRHGADFLNGLLSWVPRVLLPSKETFHIGGWLRQVYEPHTINGWPPALPGAWYINFGSLGILLGAILSGFLLAVFDAHYRDKSSPWNIVMGVMLPLLIAGGGISMGLPQQIFMTVLPLWVLCLLAHGTPRLQATPGAA